MLLKFFYLVGSSTGTVTLYELRQSKQTTIHAHSSAVTACAFSPDGKYLVSYACGENKLCFWQTSTGKFVTELTKDRVRHEMFYDKSGGDMYVAL